MEVRWQVVRTTLKLLLVIASIFVLVCVGRVDEALSSQLPQPVASSISDESICYMRTTDGRTIDLDKLCQTVDAPKVTTPEQAFLEAYQQSALQNSEVGTLLVAQAKTEADSIVDRAKSVCEALKAGISLEEIQNSEQTSTQMESDPVVIKTYQANSAIAKKLAPQYYCPNFIK